MCNGKEIAIEEGRGKVISRSAEPFPVQDGPTLGLSYDSRKVEDDDESSATHKAKCHTQQVGGGRDVPTIYLQKGRNDVVCKGPV